MPSGARPVELIARGLLRHADAVLLCRSVKRGYYYLPGGHVDPGESAAQALAREFLEEAATEIRVGPCLLVSENAFGIGKSRHHEVNLVFHVEHPEADPSPTSKFPAVESTEESIEFAWVRAAEIPGLDLRPANIKQWVIHVAGRTGQAGSAGPAGFSNILWTSDLDEASPV